jgi:hypothetical protein
MGGFHLTSLVSFPQAKPGLEPWKVSALSRTGGGLTKKIFLGTVPPSSSPGKGS